jgi:hypothetical protein
MVTVGGNWRDLRHRTAVNLGNRRREHELDRSLFLVFVFAVVASGVTP